MKKQNVQMTKEQKKKGGACMPAKCRGAKENYQISLKSDLAVQYDIELSGLVTTGTASDSNSLWPSVQHEEDGLTGLVIIITDSM